MSRQFPNLDLGDCRVFSHQARMETLHKCAGGGGKGGWGWGRYLICGLRASKLDWASFNCILYRQVK